jgi:hypothetical protein
MITAFPHSFRAQLELFMTHGVVVSPHGAGLVNEMFMVPGTGVVEIFPFHLHHNLYPNIAANMGLGYFPVHTYNGTDAWTRDIVCPPVLCGVTLQCCVGFDVVLTSGNITHSIIHCGQSLSAWCHVSLQGN